MFVIVGKVHIKTNMRVVHTKALHKICVPKTLFWEEGHKTYVKSGARDKRNCHYKELSETLFNLITSALKLSKQKCVVATSK